MMKGRSDVRAIQLESNRVGIGWVYSVVGGASAIYLIGTASKK